MAAIFITTPPSFNCRRPSLTIRHRFSSSRWLSNSELPSRLKHFNSKCTITNTDVLSPVETEEVIPEDLTSDDLPCPLSVIHDLNCPLSVVHDLNCPLSVVHLKSDVLETEPLNLLSQDTFVDTLLIALPVLSKEEQNILAATPAHPTGLYALYANCLAGNLVEQLWSFAWPASIALLHQSLLPVALIGFFSKLAVIVGGPVVGKLMDHFPRIPAYNCLSAVQAVAQLFSVGMIIHAHTHNILLRSSVLLRPWFVVLVLAGAVERLSGLTLGVAVERDWVVLLAGTNRPIALAQANAVISRINLLSEIAGASLFGILLSHYAPVTCLKITAAMMIFTLPVTVFLSWLTNKLSAGVLDRSVSATSCRNMGIESLPHSKDMVQRGLEAIKHGWVEYLQQPVLPASLACVLLCFNVVLAPSELMTAFLTQQGLNPSIIGGFSGLCALMGVAATFVSAKLVKKLGILKAGATGLILQASLLTGALIIYWTCSLSHQTPLLFFLFMIILSRLGHMSYDIVGQQILQTGIPESKVNLIGTTELSMASLAESVMLGLAIVANDPSHFGFLATLSLFSVVAAAWLFCKWLANPTETQKSVLSAVLMTNGLLFAQHVFVVFLLAPLSIGMAATGSGLILYSGSLRYTLPNLSPVKGVVSELARHTQLPREPLLL